MPRIRLLTAGGIAAALSIALIPGAAPAADQKPTQCGDKPAYKDPAGDNIADTG